MGILGSFVVLPQKKTDKSKMLMLKKLFKNFLNSSKSLNNSYDVTSIDVFVLCCSDIKKSGWAVLSCNPTLIHMMVH